MKLPVLQIMFDMVVKYFDSFNLDGVVSFFSLIVGSPPGVEDSR